MSPASYATHPGVLGGGVVAEVTVVSNRACGPYRVLSCESDLTSQQVRPGHRVAVAVGGPSTSWLSRRSLWVTDKSTCSTDVNAIELAVDPSEPGTQWLAHVEPGASLPVVAPVGRPCPLPTSQVGVVLAGVGVGCAPLFWLGRVLRERGCHVSMVLGGDAQGAAFGAGTADADTPGCVVVDSSAVAEAVAVAVTKTHASAVYGCAPWTTLEALHGEGERLGVNVFVALSELVGCGVGLCGGCALPIRGKDGLTRMVRGCVEGPVFRSERVRWDSYEDGWCMVPPDAVGAGAMGWCS